MGSRGALGGRVWLLEMGVKIFDPSAEYTEKYYAVFFGKVGVDEKGMSRFEFREMGVD